MSTLLVYASARELRELEEPGIPTLELGVGVVAATMSLTVALVEHRADAVLLAGVCGAYPQRHLRAGERELELASLVVVASESSSDAGVLMPTGFVSLAELGLAEARSLRADPTLSAAVAELLGCPQVAGTTASTGAGVDALSEAHARRSGAAVESMEGAAVATVCARFGVPMVQLRAVSNRTGDRDRGGWDLDAATLRLAAGLRELIAAQVLP